MKNKRGITLITLVITIIVLLILAGISLSLTLGENGILTKAKISKATYDISDAKESVEIEAAAYVGEYYEKKTEGSTADALDNYVAGKLLSHNGEKYGEYVLGVDGKAITLTLGNETVTGTIVASGAIIWEDNNSDGSANNQSLGKLDKQFFEFEIIEEPQTAVADKIREAEELAKLKNSEQIVQQVAYNSNDAMQVSYIDNNIQLADANTKVGKATVKGVKLENVFEDVMTESELMKHLKNKPTTIDSDTESEVEKYNETLSRLHQEFVEEYSETVKSRMGVIEIPEKVKLNSSGEIDENGKEYEIVGIDGVLPETNYDYEEIDYIIMLAQSNIEKIILPNTIKTIGDSAFSNFYGVKSINIPNSLESIGDRAFYCCSQLTSITLPNTLNSLGGWVFGYCTKFESVAIPSSLNAIPQGAFSNCSNLTTITLPDTVTSIGKSAFIGCKKLKNINFTNELKTIDEKAFKNCESLETLVLPEGLTSIGSEAFEECYKLKSVQNLSAIQFIPYKCFSGCIALDEIDFGNVSKIRSYAFEYCNSLKYLNLPEGVTYLGERAFNNCKIETYVFPKSLQGGDHYCFYSSTAVPHVIKYRGTEEEWGQVGFIHFAGQRGTRDYLNDQLQSITYNYTGE